MIDMSKTIEAKSDQQNADNFLSGPRTVTITKVTENADKQQPISIHFEGDEGKPWKPCLTCRRLLVAAWKTDGTKYIGRSLTLFNDHNVVYAGAAVGGIRISHVSHLEKKLTVFLNENGKVKKPHTLLPLVINVPAEEDAPALDETEIKQAASSAARKGKEALQAHWKTIDKQSRAIVQTIMEDLKALAVEADTLPADADFDAGNITDDPFEGEK